MRPHTELRNSQGMRKLERTTLLSERSFDGSRNLGRVGSNRRFEAFHRLAVAVEQKLGKVPLDIAANLRVYRLIRQEGIEGSLIFTQHTDLGYHGKSNIVLVM